MEATTHRDNRFSLGFTAGKSASADALPVVAARGFSLEGDMALHWSEKPGKRRECADLVEKHLEEYDAETLKHRPGVYATLAYYRALIAEDPRSLLFDYEVMLADLEEITEAKWRAL